MEAGRVNSSTTFVHDGMGYTGIIMDLDGVLVDSEPLHEDALRTVCTQHGIRVTPAALDAVKGRGEREVFEYLIQEHGDGRIDPAVLVEQKRAAYRQLLPRIEPIDGAFAFVRRVARSGARMALTTSSPRVDQEAVFEMFDLASLFEVVVTGDDVTRPKPDPQPYRVTAERMGLRPEACVVVEDSVHGVESARRAGCRVIAVTTSFGERALRAAGAHRVVDGFEELEGEAVMSDA